MEHLQKLSWCPSERNLENFSKQSQTQLPQYIRLVSCLKCTESKIRLKRGQILKILYIQKVSYLNGKVKSSGSEEILSVPLTCPYAVDLKLPNDKLFASLTELTRHEPLPKFVEVMHVGKSLEQKCAVGEILKLIIVEKSGDEPIYVHFRKSSGNRIKIGCSEEISFKLAADYHSNNTLNAFIEKSNEVPVCVVFSSTRNTPKSYLDLGMIDFMNKILKTEVIVVSTLLSATEYIMVLPIDLSINFEVCKELSGQDDYCTHFSKVLIEDVVNILEQPFYLKRNMYCFILKFKKLKKQLRNKTIIQSSSFIITNDIQVTDDNILSDNFNIDKSLFEISKNSKKLKKEKEYDKEDDIENDYLNPQSFSNKKPDKQWPSLLKKGVKKACTISIGHKSKANQSASSENITKSAQNDAIYEDCKEEFYCELPYSKDQLHLEKKSDEIDDANSIIPPPLPGNHPHQAKIDMSIIEDIYLDAIDSNKVINIKSSVLNDVESYITSWSVEEVGHCLTNLSLDKYKNNFSDSLVDGKLLLDLDETVLMDLGMDAFEAIKLRKFVLGWRPKTCCSETYLLSDNPIDWSVKEVVFRMRSIDIPEVAEFCSSNEIDGQFLKEICINGTIMNLILTSKDKKLKTLKIKNYVIDKWRPNNKKCSSDANVSTKLSRVGSSVGTYSSTFSNRSSVIERKKDDAPHISRLKQQLENKANRGNTKISFS